MLFYSLYNLIRTKNYLLENQCTEVVNINLELSRNTI